ncbi:phage tail tape measure protein [Oscillibacter sp.]|uniref:phage tail tape measure protein n=1 Tax=Oscillibacter sp. TaxID=1945593 RepID=UPI0028A8ED6A|nr:phage tail tape measure protein [Oscillibacter sp.]
MGLESVFKLSLIMNMIDNLTGPMAKVSASTGSSISKIDGLSQSFANAAKAGAAMAGIGAQITDAALAPVAATFETKNALGELSSLGVKDLGAVEDAAKKFSDTWAGTTKSDFISAAYDIKSGIATLSDEGVAQMTDLASLTAKATKSTAGEMTSLFATGYNIYKDYYGDLSDLQFGEMFSSGIAQSVKQFKTTGSGMANSIQTLGASATNSNIPLEEQLSILGMLQSTMGGAEAGTKYKAFLRSVAKGGEELGLKFTDTNNQLLSMPEIIDKLRGKFGETMDAAEKMKLQQAFGDSEAVSLIDLMYNKTGDLQGNIVDMYGALSSGVQITQDMASAINSTDPQRFQVLKQQVQNVKEAIGDTLLPTISGLMEKSAAGIEQFGAWVQNNQQLVKVIMLVALGLGGFLTVAGSTIAVVGGIGLVFTKASGLLGGFGKAIANLPDTITTVRLYGMFAMDAIRKVGGALPGLISTIGKFGAAILASPVTWIILGIVALIVVIVLLYKNWDKVTTFFKTAWTAACNGVGAGIDWIKNGFQGFITWIGEKIAWFGESGKRLITTFVNGIKSVASKPIEAVKGIFGKIGNLFPHSDAKEGPLSTLTLSGRRTMTTYAQGVSLAQAAPAQAIQKGLSKAKVTLDREPVKKVRFGSGNDQDADTDETKSSSSGGKRVIIQKLLMPVDLKQMKDLKQLLKLLAEIEDYANGNDGESDDLSPEPA